MLELKRFRGIIARVDDGRLGSAVAGMVTRQLVVSDVTRRDGEVAAEIVSSGSSGRRVYGVTIGLRFATCSCKDYRERGVLCKHIAALALHELGEVAAARSERRDVGLLVRR